MKRFLIVCAVIVAGLFAWHQMSTNLDRVVADGPQNPIVAGIAVPEFSEFELSGKAAFEEKCVACHGVNAAGNDGMGPLLVHRIYEPSHHGDGSFVVAARNGVRSHHWNFGNMPPVHGITDDEIVSIIAFVRKLQRANGIN